MRAVILEVPEHWLEERRRYGQDKLDEVWDGVLHMVPPPSLAHARIGRDLFLVLTPIAMRLGFEAFPDGTGLYGVAGPKNYRVPDVVVVDPKHLSNRGIEQRAEVVVEVLSPNDESREKFPFYASCGVREVWLIDPTTRAFEIYSLTDRYSTAGDRSEVLGIRFSVVAGPKLRLAWADGAAEI